MLPEDSVVVTALNAGDEKMFEQVFRHYYGMLCSYANSFVNDADDAEDVVQQVMITIWEKRNSMQITSSLKSYLFRSVHNASLNRIRQKNTVNAFTEDRSHTQETFHENTSGHITGKELNQQIGRAIDSLPDQCRMVFKLSRFENMKYAEIASHLNISVKTVENHMGKALKLLRAQLSDFLVWIIIIGTIWIY